MDKSQHTNLAEAIKKARETFLIRTELYELQAQEIKARFDALISVGFTEAQALFLLKGDQK